METFQTLSPRIQGHLKSIAATAGMENKEDALVLLTTNWLEKRQMFLDQTQALKMISIDSFSIEDTRAVLLLTYSGSLVALGPQVGQGRNLEYASIKLRLDVPDLVKQQGVTLAEPLKIDHPGVFGHSALARCSDVLHLVTLEEGMSIPEQEKRLREAVIWLTNGFAKINRSLTQTPSHLDHFTQKNMVQYLAKKNDLTQNEVKQLLEDWVTMVEAGTLLGEKVPLGRLGKMSLSLKKAQKARVGRNPLTGEELVVNAKPATLVPRFSFSKAYKDKASTQTPQE